MKWEGSQSTAYRLAFYHMLKLQDLKLLFVNTYVHITQTYKYYF